MWIAAGLLLGGVLLASLVGFHFGPHSHVVAAGLGVGVAVWLAVMAITGHSGTVMWTLFSADLVVSAGVGTMAWKGLSNRSLPEWRHGLRSLEGAEGIAVTPLDPDGVVRVHGENWSATSSNGPVPKGGTVQVIEASGVRLSVWADDEHPALGGDERRSTWV